MGISTLVITKQVDLQTKCKIKQFYPPKNGKYTLLCLDPLPVIYLIFYKIQTVVHNYLYTYFIRHWTKSNAFLASLYRIMVTVGCYYSFSDFHYLAFQHGKEKKKLQGVWAWL